MSELQPTGAAKPVAPNVSMATKLSYGAGGFGKDFSLSLVNTFLFFYLTDIAEMSAAVVGLVFLIARIWDTINDPIFGYLVVKYKNKWGYKPWIFFGNILNAVFIVLCFCTHLFEGTTQIIYMAVVYIGWGMAYTICDAPFWSLIPTITLDNKEREDLLPYPRFAATMGSYLASGLGVYAVKLFSDGDEGFGYIVFGAIGGILAVVSATITCKWTEQNYEISSNDDFSIKEAWYIVTHNNQFLVFLTMAFCFVVATGMMNGMNLYIFKYVLGDETVFSTQMLWASVASIPTLIFFKFLVGKIGRKLSFCLAISFPAACATFVALASFTGATQIFVILSGLVWGYSNAAYWSLVMIMVADTVDYGDYKYNVRSECIYYSLHTLLSKCSGALSGAVIGILLTMIDYVPNVEQSEGTISGMLNVYWLSSLFCIAGLAIYLVKYKLNGETLQEIQRALTRRYVDQIVKKANDDNNAADIAKQ